MKAIFIILKVHELSKQLTRKKIAVDNEATFKWSESHLQ